MNKTMQYAVAQAHEQFGKNDRIVQLERSNAELIAALESILGHSNEFDNLEDYETMIVKIEGKCRAALERAKG